MDYPTPSIHTETSKTIRAIVIDDNQTDLIIAVEYLKYIGVDVVAAKDDITAIELLMLEWFDIVFMDIHMPSSNGIDLTKCIREGVSDKINKSIPIVAYTSSTLKSDINKALTAGMNDYLSKPVTIVDFKMAIDMYCVKDKFAKVER